MENTEKGIETWAIVELFGHSRMAGFVTTVAMGATSFLRVDVPESGEIPGYTRFVNPSAVYALNPCDEATARQAATAFRPQPVQPWELPKQLPARVGGTPAHDDDDENGDDPELY